MTATTIQILCPVLTCRYVNVLSSEARGAVTVCQRCGGTMVVPAVAKRPQEVRHQ